MSEAHDWLIESLAMIQLLDRLIAISMSDWLVVGLCPALWISCRVMFY